MEAIESGTRIAATVLGLDHELGTIGEGKLANLLVVEGNPLEDMEILFDKKAITLIMQDGKLVKGA